MSPRLPLLHKLHLLQHVTIIATYYCKCLDLLYTSQIVYGSVPVRLFPVLSIFARSLGVTCCNSQVFSGGHKTYSRIGVSSTDKLPFCFQVILKLSEMAILSKLALPILETFILISFVVDLSLNQTLLIYQLSLLIYDAYLEDSADF